MGHHEVTSRGVAERSATRASLSEDKELKKMGRRLSEDTVPDDRGDPVWIGCSAELGASEARLVCFLLLFLPFLFLLLSPASSLSFLHPPFVLPPSVFNLFFFLVFVLLPLSFPSWNILSMALQLRQVYWLIGLCLKHPQQRKREPLVAPSYVRRRDGSSWCACASRCLDV